MNYVNLSQVIGKDGNSNKNQGIELSFLTYVILTFSSVSTVFLSRDLNKNSD